MKKQIRVLTGYHAGARLELCPGVYRVGRDSEADIQITDWHGNSMELEFRSDGIVTLDVVGRGRTASRMESLIPRRIYEVVMCIGPTDDTWPSDMTLLNNMLESERAQVEPSTHMRRRTIIPTWMRWSTLCVTAALIVGIGIVVSSSQGTRAATTQSAAAIKQSVIRAKFDRAFSRLGLSDVRVFHDGNKVMLVGTVKEAHDKVRLNQLAEEFKEVPITTRLAVGNDVADQFQSSLGESGVSVQYSGRGVFRVVGTSTDMQDLKNRIERVRSDFGDVIEQLDFEVKERVESDTSASSILATDSVRYVELADGTKSFSALVDTSNSVDK
jgi:type III secretion protein D